MRIKGNRCGICNFHNIGIANMDELSFIQLRYRTYYKHNDIDGYKLQHNHYMAYLYGRNGRFHEFRFLQAYN